MYDTDDDGELRMYVPRIGDIEAKRPVSHVEMPDGTVRDDFSGASYPHPRIRVVEWKPEGGTSIRAWAVDRDETWYPVYRIDGEDIWHVDPTRKIS